MVTKRCARCGMTKDASCFYLRNGKPNGYCKKCNTSVHRSNSKKARADREWALSNPRYTWAYNTRNAHVRRGHTVTITPKEILELAKLADNCPICGCSLVWGKNTNCNTNDSPSLDRKDNSTILSKENVWIICQKCNRTKSNRTMAEFVAYCTRVSERFGAV